jgi:hypothetical protein
VNPGTALVGTPKDDGDAGPGCQPAPRTEVSAYFKQMTSKVKPGRGVVGAIAKRFGPGPSCDHFLHVFLNLPLHSGSMKKRGASWRMEDAPSSRRTDISAQTVLRGYVRPTTAPRFFMLPRRGWAVEKLGDD